jgi:hypothetical protein
MMNADSEVMIQTAIFIFDRTIAPPSSTGELLRPVLSNYHNASQSST